MCGLNEVFISVFHLFCAGISQRILLRFVTYWGILRRPKEGPKTQHFSPGVLMMCVQMLDFRGHFRRYKRFVGEHGGLVIIHSSRQLCCFPFIVARPVILIKALKKHLKIYSCSWMNFMKKIYATVLFTFGIKKFSLDIRDVKGSLCTFRELLYIQDLTGTFTPPWGEPAQLH